MVEKQKVEDYLNESMGKDPIDDYIKDKITLDELIDIAGGLDELATKDELQGFLDNDFMVGVKSDGAGVSKDKVRQKIRNILDRF